jgi:hypothetical protein
MTEMSAVYGKKLGSSIERSWAMISEEEIKVKGVSIHHHF